MLRRMAHTTHTEAGVVRHRLNVGFTGNDPTDADSWRLQPFRAGAGDEHVAVIEVLNKFDSADGWRMEHFVRLVEKNTIPWLLCHLDEFSQFVT